MAHVSPSNTADNASRASRDDVGIVAPGAPSPGGGADAAAREGTAGVIARSKRPRGAGRRHPGERARERGVVSERRAARKSRPRRVAAVRPTTGYRW